MRDKTKLRVGTWVKMMPDVLEDDPVRGATGKFGKITVVHPDEFTPEGRRYTSYPGGWFTVKGDDGNDYAMASRELFPVLEIGDLFVHGIVATRDVEKGYVRKYAWGLGRESELATQGIADTTICGVIVDEQSTHGGKWYMAFVADTYSPPMILVQASSLDDAYEIFINHPIGVNLMKIDDKDADEMDDDVRENTEINGDGVLLNTNALSMFPISELILHTIIP
jgi:hypothetical protein